MYTERKRILIAEDDSAGVVIRYNLDRAGYRAVLARNDHEAWQYLQQQSFDLLIIDQQMPELEGLRLCRRVRESAGLSDLPIIMVSVKGLERQREPWLERIGPIDVINRPFKPTQLIALISDCLAAPAA